MRCVKFKGISKFGSSRLQMVVIDIKSKTGHNENTVHSYLCKVAYLMDLILRYLPPLVACFRLLHLSDSNSVLIKI